MTHRSLCRSRSNAPLGQQRPERMPQSVNVDRSFPVDGARSDRSLLSQDTETKFGKGAKNKRLRAAANPDYILKLLTKARF